MNIQQLIVGEEYKITHACGQPPQKVKVLSVEEEESEMWGKYWTAYVIFTSDDCTKGMRMSMNEIECERYLHPLEN
jgi:hypothetical protein